MTTKIILALAQAHRREPSRANYDALADAVRALVAERDHLRNSLHTCGPTCSKAGCVNSRMQVVMRQALHALENHGGNYKLTDAGCVVHDAAISAIEKVLK